jgi:hypothetical protein
MQLIDFNNSKNRALAHGFIKGLCAPIMLFHSEQAPSIPRIDFIKPLQRSDFEAIKGDWNKIGNDIKIVVDKYGETTATN